MAAPDIRFVELTPETAATLARGADALFDNPLRPDSLKAFLDDPNHLLWFAVADGQAGRVRLRRASCSTPTRRRSCSSTRSRCWRGFRRRGIGRALVARLVEAARARGCDYAWLGTETDNVERQRLFRLGAGGGERRHLRALRMGHCGQVGRDSRGPMRTPIGEHLRLSSLEKYSAGVAGGGRSRRVPAWPTRRTATRVCDSPGPTDPGSPARQRGRRVGGRSPAKSGDVAQLHLAASRPSARAMSWVSSGLFSV